MQRFTPPTKMEKLINASVFMKQNQDQNSTLYIPFVGKFLIVVKKERKMELRLFNGIIMVVTIKDGIFVNLITLHLHLRKSIDFVAGILFFLEREFFFRIFFINGFLKV